MTKRFLTYIALISSLAFFSLAQDCNNPLLGFFNLPGLDTPQSGSDLPFCASLQGANTCCSADVVSAFQNRTNGLIDTLNTNAAARDLYLAQLNNRYLATFNQMLQNISDNNSADLKNILQLNASVSDTIQGIINNATQASQGAQGISSGFTAALDNYQKLRTTCFDTALSVQASAWCLACDPNYATEGVAADDTITFSDGLCQAISSACYPYFNQSSVFDPLFNARGLYWGLLSVVNYLKNYTTNGVLNAFNIAQDPYNPLGFQDQTFVPPQWTGNGNNLGPAQCQGFWAADGELSMLMNIGAGQAAIGDTGDNNNEEAVIIPAEEAVISGEEDNGESETQVVSVTVDSNTDTNTNSRLLQDAAGTDGTWAPDLTATGLNFDTLRVDPGDYFGIDWDITDEDSSSSGN